MVFLAAKQTKLYCTETCTYKAKVKRMKAKKIEGVGKLKTKDGQNGHCAIIVFSAALW